MNSLRIGTIRVLLLTAAVIVLEWLCRSGAIAANVMPAPSIVVQYFWDLTQTHQFRADLSRTVTEIVLSCLVGTFAGLIIGVLCGRRRLLGETLEPYLVSLYAMPTLTFYPLLLALMGLGAGPIIVITSVMVAVPVALNAMVGIREISPVLVKLARSLRCGPRKTYLSVLIPAATPLVFPGIKLGVIYGVIGTIAMEFVLANAGLGYRIGFDYGNFSMPGMWANILAVVVLSLSAISLLALMERWVRRDLA